jgi:5-deoxy-glucuronate isomerase
VTQLPLRRGTTTEAAGESAWRFRDAPDHGWIRGTWHEDEIDPRLPMAGAKGRDR